MNILIDYVINVGVIAHWLHHRMHIERHNQSVKREYPVFGSHTVF